MTQPSYPEQLPTPIEGYLSELELAIKQKNGVVPEDALADAREFLSRDIEALSTSEPGLRDDEVYDHFVANFGTPAAVAEAYELAAQPAKSRLGYAPGWRICCTKCGRSAPASQAGITRIGARSVHKYVLGYCRDCRWLRWLRLERDLRQSNLTKALGVTATPEEVRLRRHKPWLVLAMIAALVIAPFSIARWFGGSFFGASPPPAMADEDDTFSDQSQSGIANRY